MRGPSTFCKKIKRNEIILMKSQFIIVSYSHLFLCKNWIISFCTHKVAVCFIFIFASTHLAVNQNLFTAGKSKGEQFCHKGLSVGRGVVVKMVQQISIKTTSEKNRGRNFVVKFQHRADTDCGKL